MSSLQAIGEGCGQFLILVLMVVMIQEKGLRAPAQGGFGVGEVCLSSSDIGFASFQVAEAFFVAINKKYNVIIWREKQRENK